MGLVLSLGVALVYLASPLATLAHFLVVEHVRCLEHGEWLHAADLAATHPGTAERHSEHPAPIAEGGVTSQLPDERLVQPDDDEPPHKHDHCGQKEDVRTHHDLTRQATVARHTAERFLVVEMAPPGQLLLALAVYAYAPKTSPPRSLL